MSDFVINSFPRRLFSSKENKGVIGLNQHIELASNNRVILEIIQASLPEEGLFFQYDDQSIQLKVDNGYFDDLLPLIEENIFSSTFDLCQSSILAFSSKEVEEKQIDLTLLPKSCKFQVKGCYAVEPIDREDVAKTWILLIGSEELEKLRLELGLSKWLLNQPFYLIMALEKYYRSFEEIFKKYH
ncbi:MAG: hypothetical protein FJZ56_06415 [Chlamydiae bacterium]|nr:hypothetical protein [Chlamydiota bacterium]